MFKKVIIVEKNVLRGLTWHSKLSSAISPSINSIAFLPWPSVSSRSAPLGDPILHRGTTQRSTDYSFPSPTWFFPSMHVTWELQVVKQLFNDSPSGFDDHHAFCSLFQTSVLDLFLNPQTWKSRVLHQLFAQNKNLRKLNQSK